jgi:hypothetical protein
MVCFYRSATRHHSSSCYRRSPYPLFFAMRRGLPPKVFLPPDKQTHTPGSSIIIVEGRTVVRIGIRDTIVRIRVTQARIAPIVSIAANMRPPQRRHSAPGGRDNPIILFFFFGQALSSPVRTEGSSTAVPHGRFVRTGPPAAACVHPCPPHSANVGVVSHSAAASQRGAPKLALAAETPLPACEQHKPPTPPTSALPPT